MEVEHGRHCNFQILEIYILLYYIIYMMLFYFIIPVFSRNQDDNKYINYKHDYTIIIGEPEAVFPVRLKAVFL